MDSLTSSDKVGLLRRVRRLVRGGATRRGTRTGDTSGAAQTCGRSSAGRRGVGGIRGVVTSGSSRRANSGSVASRTGTGGACSTGTGRGSEAGRTGTRPGRAMQVFSQGADACTGRVRVA